MENKNQKGFAHPDHPRPVTRRDFLAQGMIGFSAMAFAPTVLGSLIASQKSYAGSANGFVPYLVFDLAGGAAIPGNFLVGKSGGPEDMLKSYDLLGWDPRKAGALDKSFGIPMAADVSKILQGIRETASPQAQAALRMGSIAHFSRDDTQTNPLSAVTLVSKAGLRGSIVPAGFGLRNSESGGNSDVALKDLRLKPLQLRSVEDATESVSFGPAFRGLTPAVVQAMAKATLDLSTEQTRRFEGTPAGERLAELADRGYSKNIEYALGSGSVDPRLDPHFQKIYGITSTTAATADAALSATVVMNCLRGNSGPGVITIGGCDYHDGSQITGDNKDLQVGREIGRSVEAAFQLNTPLFFHMLTDGGVYAANGTRLWRGDAGEKCMTIIGYMNPSGPREMRRLQIGAYLDGQGVDRTTLVGAEPAKVAYAVFANYLNICGRLGEFELSAPRGVFTAAELDSFLIFA